MSSRPRTRQRVRRGFGFIAVSLVLGVVSVYFALRPDHGLLYALLFTGLPAAVGLIVGVREIVLARAEGRTSQNPS
jgi:hypothetical protein